MPRSPRVHYSGAVYHVIARGNNREIIFRDEDDKRYYLKLLAKYKEKFCFFVYAYVLMDNHIHLLIRVKDSPLSAIMQGLQQGFTQHINKKYERVGHVFQQRYNAKICNDETYLLSIVKYIHNNPRKAGIVQELHYPWSSHKNYLAPTSLLVDCHVILGLFSEKDEQAIEMYQELMEEPDRLVEQPISGDMMILSCEKESASSATAMSITFQEILKKVTRYYGLQEEELTLGRRLRKVVTVRKVIVYLALKLHVGNGSEIATALGVHPSQVSRNYYEVVKDKDLLKQVELFIVELKMR